MQAIPDKLTRVLRLPEVESITGLRHSSIYARVANGEFPKPIKLTARCVGWLAYEVEAWIAERVAERDTMPLLQLGRGESRRVNDGLRQQKAPCPRP